MTCGSCVFNEKDRKFFEQVEINLAASGARIQKIEQEKEKLKKEVKETNKKLVLLL